MVTVTKQQVIETLKKSFNVVDKLVEERVTKKIKNIDAKNLDYIKHRRKLKKYFRVNEEQFKVLIPSLKISVVDMISINSKIYK